MMQNNVMWYVSNYAWGNYESGVTEIVVMSSHVRTEIKLLELIRATVGIDMFLINTITNTVHACSSHNVSSRTLNRLVIDRTTTLTADKVIHCYG